MDKIHAVITANSGKNGFNARMLDYTLNLNVSKLDQITIITDLISPDICAVADKYNLKYIKTDLFYRNKSTYDRGAVLSEFLINKNGWMLQLDCDIILPKDFKSKINLENLNKDIMYGARRIMFESVQEANAWQETNSYNEKIYCPIGFCYGYFQLFNMESQAVLASNKNNIYPSSGHIGDHDVWFRSKWGLIIDRNENTANFIVIGDLKELPFKVGHLGFPSVNNEKNLNIFD